MLVNRFVWALSLATSLLLMHLPALAAGESEDLDSLRREIEALKAGQQKITRDLAEIKQLLKSGQAPGGRPQKVQDINVVMDVSGDPFKGAADAPITLVELTDFECPFCRRHADQVMPEIVKNYVDTAKLRYVVRDFPLHFHKKAEKAAEAAHCAGDQGKYWEMHSLLFANQKALGAELLVGYAAQAGLDTDAFKSCLESGAYSQKVKASHAEGSKAGVSGTPTTFLGITLADGKVKFTRRITGAQPYQVFQQAIEEMLPEGHGSAQPEEAQPKTEQPTAAYR